MMSLFFLLISPALLVLSNEMMNEESLYPPHWSIAPSSLSAYPLIETSFSSYRSIDPWFYPHRLGLYKILIEITTPFMQFCSSSNASNIFFALPSQFGWLFQSNRLFTNGTMNMSSTSWWASANYYLAAVPFLVAIDMNLIQAEPFEIIRQENFCTNFVECQAQVPEAMQQWKSFFIQLLQSKTCLGNQGVNQRLIDRCYLAPMWSAYKSSIDDALPLVTSKLEFLPSTSERDFGLAWAKLINLISLTRKNTNLYETVRNQRQFLPFRVLTENDRTPDSTTLPDTVKKSLELLFSIRFDWLSLFEKIWQRITCNYQARVEAQFSLDTIAVSKWIALHYLMKATVNAFLYSCDRFS